ncbi:S8 family serine peptidase [Microlunatus ginsengisoli]|uniref:Fibronectin type-III domain-containing protein n=1 Tax=Microlunatus ginsengisoli TaxID=363863 RepID=A0ABP6ZJB1_9ACTN
MSRRVLRSLGVIAATALVATIAGPLAPAEAATTARYIVTTTNAGETVQAVNALANTKAKVKRQYRHVMQGFSAELTDAQVRQLRADPGVESVVPNTAVHAISPVRAAGQQTSATWGLDRIDQRTVTRDGKYGYDLTGAGVTAYVIDTGIRMDHSEFQGRAVSGHDFVDNDDDASDCPSNYLDDPDNDKISHGTHVAATIGGATYGVAKQVSLVSLRVLNCSGGGDVDTVVAALEWVAAHKSGPSVVNMSLGGDANEALDKAVAGIIAKGVPVTVAAGNSAENACGASPARVPAALTVGATDRNDHYADFTNWGSCLDLFAPGVDIVSAGTLTTTASLTLSGTSMASPHVAGAVARYLQAYPKATPAQVSSAIIGEATTGVVNDDESPNRLLFTAYATQPTNVTSSRSDKSKTVTVHWSAPISDGGYPVTGYQLVRSGKDAAGHASATANVGAGVRSYTFGKLKAGTTYTITVRARNARALGVPSTTKQTITAVPGAPKITSAKSGSTKDKKRSISVRWSKPTSGGPVKTYVISVTRNSTGSVKAVTMSSRARAVTISGLKNKKAYTVRVKAANDSGGTTAKWNKSVKAR